MSEHYCELLNSAAIPSPSEYECCGKIAHFKIEGTGNPDDPDEPDFQVWLCAEHYDEFIRQITE